MTTTVRGARRAYIALAVVAISGVLLPAIVALVIGLTVDTKLRIGDVGTFVSSSTSAGGFFTLPATAVQTSSGSVIVSGPLSAVRDQRLQVEDRLKSGLHLCVLAGQVVCADVAGEWTGEMQPVGHQRQAFAWLAARISASGVAAWFLLGLLSTLLAIGMLGPSGEASEEMPSDDSDCASVH